MAGLDYLSRQFKRKSGADLLLSGSAAGDDGHPDYGVADEAQQFGRFDPLLPVDKLDPFPDHPFEVVENQEVQELLNSAKQIGIHTPICVIPNPDAPGRYCIMYGHRRTYVARKLGMTTIPGFVRELDMDVAKIIMSESNNLGRKNILPMEKARSLRMELIGMKELAKKGRKGLYGTDTEMYSNVEALLAKLREPGVTPRDLIAEKYGESAETVRRYIRLNNLIPELQQPVDRGAIKIRTAVDLSYLTQPHQEEIAKDIQETGKYPSAKQAAILRERAWVGNVTSFTELLEEETQAKEEKAKREVKITLDYDELRHILGDLADDPEKLRHFIRDAVVTKAQQKYTKERKMD